MSASPESMWPAIGAPVRIVRSREFAGAVSSVSGADTATLRLPATIVFGCGASANALEIVAPLSSRVFVVASPSQRVAARELCVALTASSHAVELAETHGEPEIAEVDRLASIARAFAATRVVGMGGGSALDAAKAVAALVTNDGSVGDYLEDVGTGRVIEHAALPFIAMPSTAGTGTEATPNAVITAPAHRLKRSIRHPSMLPEVAVLDPLLTLSCPRETTLASGLDALTQNIESYLTRKAGPATDMLALTGIRLIAGAIRRVVGEPESVEARSEMLRAAFYSGVTLSNAGLGAVHGLAPPLGAACGLPHGFACAVMLPSVTAHNATRILAHDSHPHRQRIARLIEALTGVTPALGVPAITLVNELRRYFGVLYDELEVPRLGDFGVTRADFEFLIANSRGGSSMRGNPVELTDAELKALLVEAL